MSSSIKVIILLISLTSLVFGWAFSVSGTISTEFRRVKNSNYAN